MNNDMGLLFSLLGGGCCCFFLVLAAGYIVYRLMSGKKSSSSQPPSAQFTDSRRGRIPSSVVNPAKMRVAEYGNLISRVTEDGFYIFNQFLQPGAMVHYRYRTGSGWVNRSLPYQPGPQGHFVYLGSRPNDVQVIDVAPNPPPDEVEYDSQKTIVGNNPPIPIPNRALDGGDVPDNPSSDLCAKTIPNFPSAY